MLTLRKWVVLTHAGSGCRPCAVRNDVARRWEDDVDDTRFDALSRSLSSRRTALGGLIGGVAALLRFADPEEVAAHNPLAACEKLPNPERRRACRRRARAHLRRRHCQAESPLITCRGGCKPRHNRCGKLLTCNCSFPKICLNNGSCARNCEFAPDVCPTNCLCAGPSVEGRAHCAADPLTCGTTLTQACTSTLECPQVQFCLTNSGCGGPNPNRCAPLCSG